MSPHRLPDLARSEDPARSEDSPSTGIDGPASHGEPPPTTLEQALVRMYEAEDTLRAISAGEIDALVIKDGRSIHRVFTLSTADRPYRMFVESMLDGAATVSSSGIVLYANNRLAQLLSRTPDSLLGAPLSMFLAGGGPSDWLLRSPQRPVGSSVELDLLTADGRTVPVLVGVTALDVDAHQITCLTFTDLSAQKAQDQEIARLGRVQTERLRELQDTQAELTHQASHDALTGLPNRGVLMDRIEQALAQAERSGRCTAVFFIDLDNFKRINDTRGHAAGNEVLRATADRLTASLRSMDTVARIGGDEFVVLAHDVDSELHALDIARRLVTGVHYPGQQPGEDVVTASIGVAVAVAGRGTAESLLNEADAAMYQAKSHGGCRATAFDSALGLHAQQRATAQRMLQTALDLGEVRAFYQPIVDLPGGTIAGFEALARLAGTGGTVIQPFAFIPIAEESGLIVPLGSEVLRIACLQAALWLPRPGSPPLTIAVNLSARQFESGNLVASVRERLLASGLPPSSLHLELTETATIDLRHDVLSQLGALRDLGVEIGLDDFGTGYGSLTHLRRLPLTFVKIDQSFVRGAETHEGDARIVSAVTALAANLGLRSIAEGVETEEQRQLLLDIGCDQAQGYLFARPMPADEVPAALARG